MNWVLGHALESQLTVLNLLSGELPVDPDELIPYRRESTPITGEGPGVLPLERLLDGHARVNERILARLAEMEEADFDREIQHRDRMVPLSWRLLFLNFHYNYHLGQLELLRQLAGRTDKLI
jgi:hypothetical protein